LRDTDVPFVLGGGLAIWARGGPETEHDVDFFVKSEDAERAWKALEEAGFRTEEPPEVGSTRVSSGKVMVNLIYAPSGLTFLERAESLEVHAVRMRVMSATDVLVAKLLAMREHH
jgi:hypothetical protein